MQSPLLTSLIALCIFSLFWLVMLGQQYTTPMVIVVCHVTRLHHMASLQSASCCNGTSYAGIIIIIIIIIALFQTHMAHKMNTNVCKIHNVHRGYATGKTYNTDRRCFRN